MFHLWQGIVVLFGTFVQVLEIDTQPDFSTFLPHHYQVGYPLRISQGNYDFGSQQLLDFFFNQREEKMIYGSQLLFEVNGVFLQWDLMLDDVFVISIKVTVFLGKDIGKLLH